MAQLTLTFLGPFHAALGGEPLPVSSARLQGLRPSLSREHPVGRGRTVKPRRAWRFWEHELFGTPDGRPPPGVSPARPRRMRSADELLAMQGTVVD